MKLSTNNATYNNDTGNTYNISSTTILLIRYWQRYKQFDEKQGRQQSSYNSVHTFLYTAEKNVCSLITREDKRLIEKSMCQLQNSYSRWILSFFLYESNTILFISVMSLHKFVNQAVLIDRNIFFLYKVFSSR